MISISGARRRVPLPVEWLQLVRVLGSVAIAEDPRALPRARLVGRAMSFGSNEPMIEYMNTTEFDPADVVLTDESLVFASTGRQEGALGKAEIVEWGANRVVAGVRANADALLVLADAYCPGWHGAIDRQRIEVTPACHLFCAAPVPEGHHVVKFRFLQLSFVAGMLLSIATLAAMSCAVALRLRGARKSKRVPAL